MTTLHAPVPFDADSLTTQAPHYTYTVERISRTVFYVRRQSHRFTSTPVVAVVPSRKKANDYIRTVTA